MFAIIVLAFSALGPLCIRTGHSQSMDPRVNITETLPISTGSRVKGIVSQDVLLSCKVENLPNDLKVHWQRTTFDLSTGTIKERVVQISIDLDIVDNTKWSIEKPTPYTWRLRIRSLAYTDEGNYTCYVPLSDKMNRAESNRTVFAFAYPVILEDKSSSDMTIKEGDTETLKCNATGRPTPTLLWRREGNAILPGGGILFMSGELKLTNVDYTARGAYICEAMNEVGEDTREILIAVTHSPKMSSEADSVGQALGYTRTLICYIDANPVPSTDPNENQLYWSKSGVVIKSDERRTVIASEGAYGRLVYELVITNIGKDDYGSYICTARNGVGEASSITVVLYETTEPQEDKGKASRATTLSSSTSLVVSIMFSALWTLRMFTNLNYSFLT